MSPLMSARKWNGGMINILVCAVREWRSRWGGGFKKAKNTAGEHKKYRMWSSFLGALKKKGWRDAYENVKRWTFNLQCRLTQLLCPSLCSHKLRDKIPAFRNSNSIPIGPTHNFFFFSIQPPSKSIFEIVRVSDVPPAGHTYANRAARTCRCDRIKNHYSLDAPSLRGASHQVTDSVSCTYLWLFASYFTPAALTRRHRSEDSKIVGQIQSQRPRVCFLSTKHQGGIESRQLERDYRGERDMK